MRGGAPRVTASLHPQTVINPQGKILMDTPTRAVFFGALAGGLLYLVVLDTAGIALVVVARGDWRIGAPFYFCAALQAASTLIALRHFKGERRKRLALAAVAAPR